MGTTDEDEIAEQGRRPTRPFLLSVSLSSAAVAFYFATGNATAVAVIPYLLAAWPVVDSAVWLRRHDPDSARGDTCFWLYLAYAGTAAAIKAAASLLLLVLIILASGQEPPLEPFAHLLTMMVGGWIFSCVIGWIGIALSLVRQVPVFIVPDLKRRCGGEIANLVLLQPGRRGFNRAVLIVTSSLSIPFLSVGFLLLVLQPQMPGREWMVTAGFSLLLAGAVGAVLAAGLASSRVAAADPAEAWPDFLRPGGL